MRLGSITRVHSYFKGNFHISCNVWCPLANIMFAWWMSRHRLGTKDSFVGFYVILEPVQELSCIKSFTYNPSFTYLKNGMQCLYFRFIKGSAVFLTWWDAVVKHDISRPLYCELIHNSCRVYWALIWEFLLLCWMFHKQTVSHPW